MEDLSAVVKCGVAVGVVVQTKLLSDIQIIRVFPPVVAVLTFIVKFLLAILRVDIKHINLFCSQLQYRSVAQSRALLCASWCHLSQGPILQWEMPQPGAGVLPVSSEPLLQSWNSAGEGKGSACIDLYLNMQGGWLGRFLPCDWNEMMVFWAVMKLISTT